MSFIDKAKDKAQEVAGEIKEKAGDLTNNEDLQAEGQRDQAAGKAKGAGEELKEGFSDAKDKLK